jgi:ATP-dependent DNA helicase PIF1
MTSPLLTPCQTKAFHLLQKESNVFLTGAAGTGKSFLLQKFLAGKDAKRCPVLASTGAAAVIVDGRTFHSFFGLGIMEGGRQATVRRALRSSPLQTRLRRAQCVVIDEVSMLSGETLATAQEIAQSVRENANPWGGLRIIAVGDFAQLPPVQINDRPKDWGFAHPVWEQSQFRPAFLETPVRTSESRFLSVLNDVREGNMTENVAAFLEERSQKSNGPFNGTRLFPHRASADAYNLRRLQRIEQPLHTFETEYDGQERHVMQLKKQCPISEEILLKKGALVMLRKNDTYHFPYKYVNGTLGTVTNIGEESLFIRLLNGEDIELGPEEFSLLDGNGRKRATAFNFPITLAWATTIHKAQGASIDRLRVCLLRLWEPGHAYVALSRARSAGGLFIDKWDRESIFADPSVQEFYRSVKGEWAQIAQELPDAPPTISDQSYEKHPPRIANHMRTFTLLQEKKSITEMAEELKRKEETIINHIEKLMDEGKRPDIQHLRPTEHMLTPIAKAFATHGTERLRPIFDALNGQYSYQDIKLVRLFLLQKRESNDICQIPV